MKIRTALLIAVFSIALAAAQTPDQQAPGDTPQGGDFSSNPDARKIPQGVILVKGAVPSASDSLLPLPEDGTITEKVYTNRYFGLSYPLPANWRQKYMGPPPSESGYYVLAQIEPAKAFNGPNPGTILISAQDLFFNLTPAKSAVSLIRFRQGRLNAEYKVERPPSEVKIAGHSFVRMDYMSPVAELHWYTLATQIRCHSVEFMLTSRDPALLESLVATMEKMTLPGDAGTTTGKGGGDSPVCIRDYATADNVLTRVDPVFEGRKYNPIPVRIVIDKQGKVKHVHVISAFPEQSKAITDALLQWEFRPYRVNDEPVEVETGILLGAFQQRLQERKKSNAVAQD